LIGGSPRARVDAAARRRRERNRRRASVSFTASERRRARGTESTTYRVTHALSRSISRRVRVVGHERLTAVDARRRRRAEHRLLKIARRRLRLKHGASAVRVGRFKPRLFDDVRDGDETTAASLESSRASQRAARERERPSVNRTPRAARRDSSRVRKNVTHQFERVVVSVVVVSVVSVSVVSVSVVMSRVGK